MKLTLDELRARKNLRAGITRRRLKTRLDELAETARAANESRKLEEASAAGAACQEAAKFLGAVGMPSGAPPQQCFDCQTAARDPRAAACGLLSAMNAVGRLSFSKQRQARNALAQLWRAHGFDWQYGRPAHKRCENMLRCQMIRMCGGEASFLQGIIAGDVLTVPGLTSGKMRYRWQRPECILPDRLTEPNADAAAALLTSSPAASAAPEARASQAQVRRPKPSQIFLASICSKRFEHICSKF